MRFAIVGNAASTLTNFRLPLIADIVARGHTVYAMAPDYTAEARGQISAVGAEPVDFRLARTGLNPLADWRDGQALRGVLQRLQLDSVLCYGIKPAIYGTLAAARAGIPARHVLITGLGYAFADQTSHSLKRRLVGAAARWLYRYALARARTVFMQNPDDTREFVAAGTVAADKVVTVNGTGVELDKWPPSPPVTEPVTFLLAARMLRDKGVLEFIHAAWRVKEASPKARFVLIGATDSNPEAIPAAQLKAWVETGVVEWPGHVDMRSWLAQTSVFVLPSYREGVPRSTQEAMAMGRPIITTDVPGCRETVIDGVNGFMVPARDTDALAAAMQRFIDDQGLIASMGQRSRELAERRFDVREVNALMIRTMKL